MTFTEWINGIIKSEVLCGAYTQKVLEAQSKRQIIDICLDANGIEWLPKMDAMGNALPYSVILKEFKRYINGNYVASYTNEKGNGYDSSLYCCFSDGDRIDINTTLACLLGCSNVSVHIRENDFVHLYADRNCDMEVVCPASSRCIVTCWDGAKVKVKGEGDVIMERGTV